jgi:transposase
MPKILSEERVIEYSVESKIRVVRLTLELDVQAAEIAKVLQLHPIMIYLWRQEYKEGKFMEIPSRRISMTKKSETIIEEKQRDKKIARLEKELASSKKENKFLKKRERYLKNQSKNDSAS